MTNQAFAATTPEQIAAVRGLVIASALKLYAKTGMKANRAYTPTNMLNAASQITGKKFKRGQFMEAANAIRVMAGMEPYPA